MNEHEAIDHLFKELNSVFERFRLEYQISYASAIGVLEIVKHELIEDSLGDEFDEDGDDEDE